MIRTIRWTTLSVCFLLPLAVGVAARAAEPGFPVVKSFLETHCVSCHGEKTRKADLALHTFSDEASLLKGRKTLESALEMVHAGEMPPAKKPKPKVEEIEAFTAAVNGIFRKSDSTVDPGRVTARRLNRAEYNNTIRDLMFVDFQPAEDFPSDDIGHGFDNIGDVLTLSPVLMERYLAAAEAVTARAITPELAKPTARRQQGRFLEPGGRNIPDTRFRALDNRGPLSTPYTLAVDGDYVLSTRVYGQHPGNAPVKIALTVDGKEVGQFDVLAKAEANAEKFEVKLKLEPGQHRFGVVLLNPSEASVAGAKAITTEEALKARRAASTRPTTQAVAGGRVTLHVNYIALEGPADTRPASQRKLLAVTAGKTQGEQTREVLERFALRAYRRPASEEELGRLIAIVEASVKGGEKWEAGVQLAMQAVLASPKFIFRLEPDPEPGAKSAHAIDEYQLATRLSYFLWSTMPDDELFALAGKKELSKHLDAQVRRMLKDPRSSTLVDNFAMQWLQLRRLKTWQPDAKQFPMFDERLRSAMLKETELFIEAVVKEDRSILDLIDGDFTFLNDVLARHYGIADTNGNWVNQKAHRPAGQQIPRRGGFVRVTLGADHPRGGILTHASLLTVTSNPTRTSPVKRGKFVLEQILGTPPPPPPPDVPEIKEEEGKVATGTFRQRLEQHRADPACANCHARMDPIGFAFEKFDAIGAFREKDGPFAIDTAATLPDGKRIDGAGDLRKVLKDRKEQVARALAEKLMTYALGRGIEYYDRPAVDKIVAAIAKDDYRFSALAAEIAKSDPFRMRRGTEQGKEQGQ